MKVIKYFILLNQILWVVGVCAQHTHQAELIGNLQKIAFFPDQVRPSDTILSVCPASWTENHYDPPKVTVKDFTVTNTSPSAITFFVSVNPDSLPENIHKNLDIADGKFKKQLTDFDFSVDTIYGGASPNQLDEVSIRYDDGVNISSWGRLLGGVYEIAAYFPDTIMQQYAGMLLSQIEFYTHDIPVPCKLKIYDEGTPDEPGLILYEELVFPDSLTWNLFTLSADVEITGNDLWIAFEITHIAGETPLGMDAGPAVSGFGDLINFAGFSWINFSGFGFDYNWNLAGYLSEGSPGAANDVGVQAIVQPESDYNLGSEENMIIRIKNYGTSVQDNIPVELILDNGIPFNFVISDTLQSGESKNFYVPTILDLSNVGQTYIINVYHSWG